MAQSLLSINYKDKDAVAQAVSHIWKYRASYKYELERDWFQNVAWFMGQQNLIWDPTRNKLTEPNSPSYRVRININLIQPHLRTLASKIIRNSPIWDAVPTTTDISDMQKAQLAKTILDHYWYQLNGDKKSRELVLWGLTCGNSFLHPTWDPDIGEPIVVPDDLTQELMIEDELNVGDVACEVVSPFEIVVDPRATTIDDANWVMRSRVVDYQDVIERYPSAKRNNIPKETTSSALFNFVEQIKNLFGTTNRGVTSYRSLELPTENTTVVHELWIKPRKYSKNGLKNGRHIIISGGLVLKNEEFPYIHRKLPFIHFKEIDVPGRFWGTSTLEQLKPLQASYNRGRSQTIENRNLTARPKFLVPKSAGLKTDSLTSEPGEIIEYIYPFKPEPMPTPELPGYVQNMLLQDRQDMEDISGIHEVSRAEAPGRVESGRGILALLEQDETKINQTTLNLEDCIQEFGRQVISLVAQFATESRVARVVGDNDELLLYTYTGRQLISGNNVIAGITTFDVRIKTQVGLPNSRGAQQELLSGLVELGVLNPQNESDRRMILKLLSVGSTANHMDRARVHRSRQLQEINTLKQGEQIVAEEWHNHNVHLEVLNEYRNSADYDIQSEEIKAQLAEHARQHEEYIAMLAIKPQIMAAKAALISRMQEGVGQVEQLDQKRNEQFAQRLGGSQ